MIFWRERRPGGGCEAEGDGDAEPEEVLHDVCLLGLLRAEPVGFFGICGGPLMRIVRA